MKAGRAAVAAAQIEATPPDGFDLMALTDLKHTHLDDAYTKGLTDLVSRAKSLIGQGLMVRLRNKYPIT